MVLSLPLTRGIFESSKKSLLRRNSLNDDMIEQPELEEEDETKPLDSVELTNRDIAIFKLAHEHRYLVHSQIREGFWKNRSTPAKTPHRRIQRLVNSGFLERGYSEMKNLNCYAITEKSLAILRARNLDSGLSLYKFTPRFDRSIDHDLKLLNLRIIFRQFGLDSWTCERITREREHQERIPDGILNVSGKRIAVEFENNGLTKEIARYQAMFTYYNRHEIYALLFLIIDGNLKDWIIRVLDYDVQRVWMVSYKEILKRKEKAVFENKAASFTLSDIL